MEKLNCPNCGIDTYVYPVPGMQSEDKVICICNCCDFNSDGPDCDTEEEAYQSWNDRVKRYLERK